LRLRRFTDFRLFLSFVPIDEDNRTTHTKSGQSAGEASNMVSYGY
jgi:hypothetical protein